MTAQCASLWGQQAPGDTVLTPAPTQIGLSGQSSSADYQLHTAVADIGGSSRLDPSLDTTFWIGLLTPFTPVVDPEPEVFRWIAAVGAWADPDNWDLGAVPGPEDTALIEEGIADVREPATIATVIHRGGSLGGRADLTITERYEWSGGLQFGVGSIPGTTIIGESATWVLETEGFLNIGRPIRNLGTAQWLDGNIFGSSRLENTGSFGASSAVGNASTSVRFDNLPGGFLDLRALSDLRATEAINNEGFLFLPLGATRLLGGYTQEGADALTNISGDTTIQTSDGPLVVPQGSELELFGPDGMLRVEGDMVNDGLVKILQTETPAASPLTVTGTYEQRANGRLTLAYPQSLDGPAPISVEGATTLDGALEVQFVEPDVVESTSVVAILETSALDGVFQVFVAPDALPIEPFYALDSVTLQAPQAARVELLRMSVNAGTIELTVAATPGAQVQVDRSFNLQTWEPASVFAITEPEQILSIPFDEPNTTSLFLRISIP